MRRVSMLLLVSLMLAGCGAQVATADAAPPSPSRPRVLTRLLHLTRGVDRPLTTTIWYPGTIAGRHPIVLFSHGLGGLPTHFAPLAAGWVNAGFVVAAPTYPHTNARVKVDRTDIPNQPADAAYVLERVKALGTTPGDVLFGHLDTTRVAAVGFSAGGTTTLGLLRVGHDPSLRVAISVAGRRPASAFGGSPVPVLCIHGDRDKAVPINAGRQAFAAIPWDKRFVVIRGAGHGGYLNPRSPDFVRVSRIILDYLRTGMPT